MGRAWLSFLTTWGILVGWGDYWLTLALLNAPGFAESNPLIPWVTEVLDVKVPAVLIVVKLIQTAGYLWLYYVALRGHHWACKALHIMAGVSLCLLAVWFDALGYLGY